MFRTRRHLIIVAGWVTFVTVLFAIRVAVGGPLTLIEGLAAVIVGLAPAIVFLMIFRGAPPQTIAQVLYDAERVPATTDRRVSRSSRTGVGP